MTSCLHETIIKSLEKYFILLFDRALPEHDHKRIRFQTNVKLNQFGGEYEGSSKVPDLGIFMTNNDTDEDELKWILEIGFSEEYNNIREDIRHWLLGSTCSMVVLINIVETPTYRCPLDFDLDLCSKLNIPEDRSQVRKKDFSLQGEYGPVEYKGYQWVGQISEVFLEIWTCDPRTGQPRRKGSRMSIIPPTDDPQFQLADFLDIDNPQKTSFDWDGLRALLRRDLRLQGVMRCCDWIYESRKRAGLVDTPDSRI